MNIDARISIVTGLESAKHKKTYFCRTLLFMQNYVRAKKQNNATVINYHQSTGWNWTTENDKLGKFEYAIWRNGIPISANEFFDNYTLPLIYIIFKYCHFIWNQGKLDTNSDNNKNLKKLKQKTIHEENKTSLPRVKIKCDLSDTSTIHAYTLKPICIFVC